MEKLFAALCARNPGYKVVDVRFLPSATQPESVSVESVDNALAKAVLNSRRVDLAALN